MKGERVGSICIESNSSLAGKFYTQVKKRCHEKRMFDFHLPIQNRMHYPEKTTLSYLKVS